MCEIDTGDDSATVWDEKLIGRARKEHRCDMCFGTIAVGESYLRHFSIFDRHNINDEAQCVRCVTIRDAFRREHSTYYNPSGMRDLLRDCLNEESYWGDEDKNEDERVPTTENALRWKYALVEMDARAKRRKAAA